MSPMTKNKKHFCSSMNVTFVFSRFAQRLDLAIAYRLVSGIFDAANEEMTTLHRENFPSGADCGSRKSRGIRGTLALALSVQTSLRIRVDSRVKRRSRCRGILWRMLLVVSGGNVGQCVRHGFLYGFLHTQSSKKALSGQHTMKFQTDREICNSV